MRLNRSKLALGVSLLLSSAVLIGRSHVSPQRFAANRPECPEGGMWTDFFKHDGDTTNPYGPMDEGEVPLSGIITDIVEFHDCQQFIVEDSISHLLRYSSLFAIFARENLDSTYKPQPMPAEYDSLTWGVPMGTIFAYESAYDRLGIKKGFNCLYLLRKSPALPVAWSARVVAVDKEPKECKKPLPPAETRGKELMVTIVPSTDSTPDDSPPVARWDWDEVNRLQYIGIRCGDAWCEVHPEMDTGHTFVSSKQLTVLPHRSKGWYDEQLLTVADVTPRAPGVPPTVSAIKATFVPEPTLGDEAGDPASSHYANQWMPVGRIVFRSNAGGYTQKMNLINAGQTVDNNLVSLCYTTTPSPNICFSSTNVGPAVTAPRCPETEWYGRIEHHGQGAPKPDYFCVIRRAHDMPGMAPAPHIPGIVRWRWMLDDETIWIRCLQGCCEVKPHQ